LVIKYTGNYMKMIILVRRRLWKLCIATILIVVSSGANAQEKYPIWRFDGLCVFQGCANVRTATVKEFCSATANGLSQKYPGSGYWVKRIQINATKGWAKAACILSAGNNGEDRFYAMANSSDCPHGTVFSTETLSCSEKENESCLAGNPIEIVSGTKRQERTDRIFKFSERGEIIVSRL